MARLINAKTFITMEGQACPVPPPVHRICPTCLDPMAVWYGWKTSERVVKIMCRCDCGTRTKVKYLTYRLNRKGQLS